VIQQIHHVGIVVERLDEAYRFYRDVLGLPLRRAGEVPDQGVRAALLAAGDSEIELLEPIRPDTPAGRFLARRGQGLHHVCFETPDVDTTLAELAERGVELVDRRARAGLAGRVAFLHPRACDGVLVELATPAPGAGPDRRASARLKRLVVGSPDPGRTAARFQALFQLEEMAMNNGPRLMLAVGRGALLIVPADEVGGSEGLVALSLVSDDFPALLQALDGAHIRALRGTGEVTVEPPASHGVHLHISRYD
jgi:methylmalonyl-CoA/ethylmalonyl-CoA epimerase